MRYSLLNFLQCPVSGGELVCLTVKEAALRFAQYALTDCRRINQPGVMVGPLPEVHTITGVTGVLAKFAGETARSDRNWEVEVETGLLVCPSTGRWYPIRDFIPEILPDHLRDFKADFEFLHSLRDYLPEEIFRLINNETLFTKKRKQDSGIRHKRSEIGIRAKTDDPAFFDPGYYSPFNHHAREHTADLLKLFAFCLSLLNPTGGRFVLDTGSGYCWTTEWLLKSGFEPIGIDITRVYLDVGKTRIGTCRPYMLLADTENLPIQESCMDAVLGFDSFHHIPDRKVAMRQFDRVLKPGGHIILGEPGGAHEHDQRVREVMDKYGILEKGMELADIRAYISGTNLASVQQHHVLRVTNDCLNAPLTPAFIAEHRWCPANLFVIEKAIHKQSLANKAGLTAVVNRAKALLS